jgi:translation initiation factor IF-1
MSTAIPKFNTKGGKNYKRNKTGRVRAEKIKVMIDVEAGEGYYATVKKLLGCNNVLVELKDGTEKQVSIPGKMYKRPGCWMKPGFEILVDCDDTVVRIIRENDKEFAEAIKKNNKKDIFGNDEDEDEVDDMFDVLANRQNSNRTTKGTSRSQIGGEKSFSTEAEMRASNATVKATTNNSDDSDSDSDNDVDDIANI